MASYFSQNTHDEIKFLERLGKYTDWSEKIKGTRLELLRKYRDALPNRVWDQHVDSHAVTEAVEMMIRELEEVQVEPYVDDLEILLPQD